MSFEDYSNINGFAIYETLSNAWKMAAIDRDMRWKEAVLVPIYEGRAPIGAAIFIAIVAYPDDIKKQESYVKAVAAWTIKSAAPPKSALRREMRQNPSLLWAIETPNKRIQQKFNDCRKQFSRRLRAAWVLLQKLASHPDVSKQSSLHEFILKAAKHNSHTYPAFFSTAIDIEDENEIISDNFRQKILYTAKPVMHLAMAVYLHLEENQSEGISLFNFIQQADDWLKKTVIAAEIFRVSFGDLFPRYDTKYNQNERPQNFNVPLEDTITILPYIDKIETEMDYKWFLHQSREYTNTFLPN